MRESAGVHLDIQTLLIVSGMALLLSAGLLCLLHLRFPTLPGPRAWAAAHILIAAHIPLLLHQSSISPLWGVVLSNALLLGGASLLYNGFRRFGGRRIDWRLPLLVAGICWLPLGVLTDAPDIRIILVSLGMITLSWATAAVLLSRGSGSVTGSRLLAGVFMVLGATFVARALWAMGQGHTAQVVGDNPATAAMLIWALVYFFLLTSGMVLMVSERQATEAKNRADDLEAEIRRRHALMRQVTENEAMFRAVVHAAPFPIIVIDLTHEAMLVLNDKASKLLRLPINLAAGGMLDAHLDLGAAGAALIATLRDPTGPGEVREQEIQARRLRRGAPAGSERETGQGRERGWTPGADDPWLLISAARVSIGGRAAAILCLNDITERKFLELRLEDALAQARQALVAKQNAMVEQRNFLALVSHEFRNPLGIIQASADVLSLQDGFQDPARQETIERIRRGVQRMRKLMEDCLTEDWLEASGPIPRQEVVDIASLIRGLAQEQQGARVTLAVRVADDVPSIHGDPALLTVCFTNLIDNAVKYATAGSTATITVLAEGEGVLLTIRNQGTGIRQEEVERVFEKYYRSPTVGRLPGAGLGLFLVRQIITAHHGKVWVEGDPGHWVAFHVRLPAASPAAIANDRTDTPPFPVAAVGARA